jgi:Tfp pilus assembly protein FimT
MKYRGFVLIELVVVIGMLALLIGFATTNLLGADRRASLTATIDTLIADLRSQQTKAMTGISVGGVTPLGYGIHFEQNRYTLFQGLTYNASDTLNSVISVDTRVQFSDIALPNASVVFLSKSGEMNGYNSELDNVTVHQLDSNQLETIRLNRYGVITSIN